VPKFRSAVDIQVWPDGAGDSADSQIVAAKDVSSEGFYVHGDDPIDVGQRFHFVFRIPETAMRQRNYLTGLAEIIRRDQFVIGDTERFCLKARIVYAYEVGICPETTPCPISPFAKTRNH
jgi:hypothetical protein